MPLIRIPDETMQRLKTWAKPLKDTAESAPAKALDTAESARTATHSPGPPIHRKPSDSTPRARPRRAGARKLPPRKLPQRAFRQPLLELIHELGGSASVREVRPILEERVKPLLLPGDREFVSTGDERWWNATCRERSALVKEGYLRPDSPRGTWALSDREIEQVAGSPGTRESGPFVEHLLAIPNVGDDSDFERDPSTLRHVDL